MTSVISILLTCVLLLGIPTLNAQGMPSSSDARTGVNTELQTLSAEFNTCQQKRMEVRKRHKALLAKYRQLPAKTATANELETLLTMQSECQALQEQIESEKFAHISVKSKIDKYIASHDVMPQEMTIINHYLDDLKGYGVIMGKDEGKLKDIDTRVNRLLHTIPPPEKFTLLNGTLAFEKITVRKKKPFYIMTAPISIGQWNAVVKKCGTLPSTFIAKGDGNAPMTNITRNDAYAFIAALSRMTRQQFFLPNAIQASILSRHKGAKYAELPIALWLDGTWLQDHRSGNTDLNERDAMIRFDIKMAPVWDPACRLYQKTTATDNIIGEFAYAKYNALGIILTTTAETAWNCQLKECQDKLHETTAPPPSAEN